MAHEAHRRHKARQLHLKHRLRCARLVELEALEVVHHGRGHRERAAVGADELDLVARGKLVAKRQRRVAVRIAVRHDGADLPVADVARIVVILPGLAVVEARRIMAVAHMLYLIAPYGIDFPARGDVVEHMAVRTCDDGGVVGRLRAPLDLDAVDARRP